MVSSLSRAAGEVVVQAHQQFERFMYLRVIGVLQPLAQRFGQPDSRRNRQRPADDGAEHGLDFVETHRIALKDLGFEELFEMVEIAFAEWGWVHIAFS